jgi:hypothetical protein
MVVLGPEVLDCKLGTFSSFPVLFSPPLYLTALSSSSHLFLVSAKSSLPSLLSLSFIPLLLLSSYLPSLLS